MANASALDTLIDLAQRESDACATRLGAALKAVEEGEQKLQMLHGYRDDYANKLDAAQMAGITPFAYQNFVAFLGKLEQAIDGERKRLSYRTLNERAAAEALAIENKRDQKMMDDHAARTVRARR